jgi:hypothetical protein
MIISYLIQDSVMDETGFGIYSISNVGSMDLGEQTVVIDFVNKTITDNHPVDFQDFVNAYGPKLLTESAVV